MSVQRLAACGNDQLWWENLTVAAGTMVQLAASAVAGQLDTSDSLDMFEAYGKAIILNGANKKVFDTVNSKIATASVGTNPPDHGTLLTGGSSGATMVVDYITALSSATTVYGFRKSTATFTTGETVTGTDDDGNAISFAMTAVNEVAPPHWYDFTPYGASATYGTLSTKLYLGAMYLGRMYVAGDPVDPYEWFASRQGNIFDWLFNDDDVQSACSGADVEMGRIQDIIRALIPFGNDYLIFGCANKMNVLFGDPMQGGSQKVIPGAPGIFGAKSWCRDEFGNVYYYGVGGIYRISKGLADVQHMTEYRLPNIIHDDAADPSTHRITLEYDLKRHGIVIGIVKLSDNTNSCYWYERRSDGFYPEQYPEECAPYSMLYYNSSTIAQRDLLIGCADGYIRQFSETAKSDDVGGSDEAIDSYVTLGPFQLGEEFGEDGIVSNVFGIMGETQTVTSSNVTFYVYVGDTPEAVMKAVTADTYSLTGTVYAPGFKRGGKQRQQVRGKYAAIRLRNNTAAQTWAFEEIEVEVLPAGRLA